MKIDTSFLQRCIQTLEKSLNLLNKSNHDDIDYDMYRSACIKEFEIILEQSGKLLKKCLRPYFHSSKEVDRLIFKDIFRQAANHSIITIEETERWLLYRDNRNTTVHDYGVGFAEETLVLLPQFLKDAKNIAQIIQVQNSD